MTGKFYMLFRDDCSMQEQIHWFISNYIPADRRNFEYRYADNADVFEFIQEGVIGVCTFDNGNCQTLCWLDKYTIQYVTDYTQVFYNADTIMIGEIQ